eukprot:CAMPEP_0169079436 /NCGR_PEP_ID=MMETSP1015-20121227/9944_1 /TAXON_ID=342587 /ORGANISM="Karlodinium micrum, Strain CCMP2283" /LENGTH=274 /DNA_ID=CAMNT_0009139093 /DNA_START=277 /DNA_END=1101 /DNA_ORIENTATION=-
MLIGAYFGRLYRESLDPLMGTISHHLACEDFASSGVYSLVGAAAMLAGFKRMSLAVIVFIVAACSDVTVSPVLMIAVSVSLLINQWLGVPGFDEFNIEKKKIPYLESVLAPRHTAKTALEFCHQDELPLAARLPMVAGIDLIAKALKEDLSDFPVLDQNQRCIGFTTRKRLEAALQFVREPQVSSNLHDAEDQIVRSLMGDSFEPVAVHTDASIPLGRLIDVDPYMVFPSTPASVMYDLFAGAKARNIAVIDRDGKFVGMVNRTKLIFDCRKEE